MKTRKVGTFTVGITLIIMGVLFLLHVFWPVVSYSVILHFWPVIFIFLGIEMLVSMIGIKNVTFTYDFPAILLILFMSFFASGMGILDWFMQCVEQHIV